MIAPTKKQSASDDSQLSAQFVRMLPAIQKQIARQLQQIDAGSREELGADALALSFEMFVSLVQRGRLDAAYPTPLATYGCRLALAGRQSGTPLNVCDVTSRYCQQRKGVRVRRLDRFDRQSGCWQEILVEDRTANPADIAAMRIDFCTWLGSLNARKRRVAELLSAGESTTGAARLVRVSIGRISQVRRELHRAWQEFQGEMGEVDLAPA